jgi:hypothetical protein
MLTRKMSKCAFCNEKDHVFVSCEKAKIEGEKLHQEFVNTIIRKNNNYNHWIGDFIERSLKQISALHLDCIVAFHTKEVLQEYATDVHLRGCLTINHCAIETRQSIIRVLRFYYYNNIFGTGIFQSTDPVRNYSRLKTKLKTTKCPKKTFDCPICYLEVEDTCRVTTNCNHTICVDCFRSLEQHDVRRNPLCFYCRTDLKYVTFSDIEKREQFLHY